MKYEYIAWFKQRIEKHPPKDLEPEEADAFTASVMDRVRASAQEASTAKVIRFPVRVVGLAAAAAAVAMMLVMKPAQKSSNETPVTNVLSVESASAETLLFVLEQLGESLPESELSAEEELEALMCLVDEDSFS